MFLDLPIELQRMILDRCYAPWSLQLTDNYWRINRSPYFSLDRYCNDLDYAAFVLSGTPSPSLALTCKHIYRESQSSILQSYTGMLEISARSSHMRLPSLPPRYSFVYNMTTDLILDERAFVDLFQARYFPRLSELTISCFPIFCPYSMAGQSAPLGDEGFQDWAMHQQTVLARRSGKKVRGPTFVTVLDSQAEQWESDESVFCYLAEEKDSIQVVRERLVLPRDAIGQKDETETSSLHDEIDHVCSRAHSENPASMSDAGNAKVIVSVGSTAS